MPWLEAMLTTPYGTPIRAVSASTSGTAKDAVSSHIAAAATASSTTPAISTRRTPNRSIARTANGVADHRHRGERQHQQAHDAGIVAAGLLQQLRQAEEREVVDAVEHREAQVHQQQRPVPAQQPQVQERRAEPQLPPGEQRGEQQSRRPAATSGSRAAHSAAPSSPAPGRRRTPGSRACPSRAPVPATRPRSRAPSAGAKRRTMSSAASASGTLIRNSACQPTRLTSSPPTTGPTAAAGGVRHLDPAQRPGGLHVRLPAPARRP